MQGITKERAFSIGPGLKGVGGSFIVMDFQRNFILVICNYSIVPSDLKRVRKIYRAQSHQIRSFFRSRGNDDELEACGVGGAQD